MEEDTRFAHVARDPKFRRIQKAERKVKIDRRFQSMFKDKNFTVNYTMDKRGRPISHNTQEDLRKYYELSSSEDETDLKVEDSKSSKTNKKKNKKKQKNDDADFSSNGELLRIKPKKDVTSSLDDSSDEDNSENDSESFKEDLKENKKQLYLKKQNEKTPLSKDIKKKLENMNVNYARGEGLLMSESSSEEESSDDYDEEDDLDHNWGEFDKEAETTDVMTNRLAVCNMDWDRIRAIDLLVLFRSFLPPGGIIHSVTIYPSKYGLERLKEEEVKGPIEVIESKNDDNDLNDETEEGSRYHMEKLRQYQLNRLKYYEAVAVFDSPETAEKIYYSCNGVEYESTGTIIDLRVIGDDRMFDQEPKDHCEDVPDIKKYEPRNFITTALQQVNVKLTWDETNPEREELTKKLNSGKIDEVDKNDIQAYLAGASSEDDEDNEDRISKTIKSMNEDDSDCESNKNPIQKYKSLLKMIEEQEDEKKKNDMELEFTWGLEDKEKSKQKEEEKQDINPFEKYLQKRKEKRKARKQKLKNANNSNDSSDSENSSLSESEEDDKLNSSAEGENKNEAELELLLLDKNDDGCKNHFNMKKIEENYSASKSKKKSLKKKQKLTHEQDGSDFKIKVDDPRFAALYTSHHFNVDPTDPHYRKTEATEAIVEEKLKRRKCEPVTTEPKAKQPKNDSKLNIEMQALVNKVKKNTKNKF